MEWILGFTEKSPVITLVIIFLIFLLKNFKIHGIKPTYKLWWKNVIEMIT